MVGSIAAAAEQQATGLQQVNTAVSEMDGVTQQNAAMVEEATAAARSLADEAGTLSGEVARFTLKGTAERASHASPVRALQARAADVGRRIAQDATRRPVASIQRPSHGNLAVATDDWSAF
ncbi:hypothetical protein J2Y58_002297 [Sphingomonas sp. BE138]|nr:hypothetical protein [Sphingomonas sp. BE138]